MLAVLVSMVILSALAACADDNYPIQTTPTSPNPAEIAMSMVAQELNAKATQQMIGIQFTATAQVIEATQNVESTQAALAATEQARRDAQATDQQARQDAAATEQARRDDAATEQARRDAAATAEQGRVDAVHTQEALATATWDAMTMTAVYPHATLTQIAVDQQIVLATNAVEQSNLEVKRQSMSNSLQAMVPWMAVIAAICLIGVVLIRKSRVVEITNQETGVVEGLLVDTTTVIRPQLMPGPVINDVLKKPLAPQLTDKETQDDVTRRAQAVEALRAMPTERPTSSGASLMNNVFGGNGSQPYQVLRAGETPPAELISGDTVEALEQDWKENDGH